MLPAPFAAFLLGRALCPPMQGLVSPLFSPLMGMQSRNGHFSLCFFAAHADCAVHRIFMMDVLRCSAAHCGALRILLSVQSMADRDLKLQLV